MFEYLRHNRLQLCVVILVGSVRQHVLDDVTQERVYFALLEKEELHLQSYINHFKCARGTIVLAEINISL